MLTGRRGLAALHGGGQRKGTPLCGVPVGCDVRDLSGERGFALAAGNDEVVTDTGGKHVVRFLKPG
jgi:hypothetical protein